MINNEIVIPIDGKAKRLSQICKNSLFFIDLVNYLTTWKVLHPN